MMSSSPRLELAETAQTGSPGVESILAAVLFGAQKFLKKTEWSDVLVEWLERLGLATGASQVRIFANDPAAPGDPVRSSMRAQWIAPGANRGSPFGKLQHVSFRDSGCARWEELLSRGEPVIGEIDECPSSERPILLQEGITSFAMVPVFVGPRWWGFIGFAECQRKRTWSTAELNALAAAAGIYGAALERQELEQRIEAANMHEQLAASIGEAVTAKAEDLAETLQRASVRISQHLGADLVRIWALNRDGTRLHSDSGAFSLGEKLLPCEVAIGELAVGHIAACMQSQEWTDGIPELWPGSTELLAAAGLRAGVGHPLMTDGRVVGVVVMLTRGLPSRSAVEGLYSVTDELALAIERSRAIRALSLTEDRYRRLVEGTVEGICIHDGQRILDGNPSIANMVGYELDEIIGHSPLDFIHPDDHPQVRRNLASNFTEGYEVTMVRRDGSTFPAELKGRDFLHDGVKLRVASIRNLTERKAAEQIAARLRDEQTAREVAERSRSNAEFLLDASRILASSFDTSTVLNQLAHLAVRFLADSCVVSIFNDDQVEHVAAVHADPSKSELLTAAIEMWNQQWAGEHPLNLQQRAGEPFIVAQLADTELDAMARDPEHRRVLRELDTKSFMSVPIITGGHLIGTMMFSAGAARGEFGPEDLEIAQELGRRAALALQSARSYHDALDATTARDEVLAIVAHDLRNPLNTIHMSSSLALDEEMAALEPMSRKQFEIILRSADHMNRLIQDLLDATRLRSGQLVMEFASVAPSSVVDDAMEILRPLATHAGIALEPQVVADLPCIKGDKIRLLQVLSNLVGNALKFTPRGGRVSLRVMPRDGSVCFAVIDTGPGIPEDQLPHVFGRFWQARKTDRRGLGLGLSIAKGIVEAHGGSIWVESRAGEGSSFLFTIPA